MDRCYFSTAHHAQAAAPFGRFGHHFGFGLTKTLRWVQLHTLHGYNLPLTSRKLRESDEDRNKNTEEIRFVSFRQKQAVESDARAKETLWVINQSATK